MKRFNLLVYVYRGINTLEEKIIRKDFPTYQSKLSKNILIITAISLAAQFIGPALGVLFALLVTPDSLEASMYSIIAGTLFPYVCLCVYWIFYLRRHLHLIQTNGRKISYGLFTFFLLVVFGPFIFPMLLAIIVLTIALSVALFLLRVVLVVVDIFNGNGNSKRFTLDNGDKVTERSGLFGEKYYTGDSGKRYTTNDGGRTFQ